MKKIYTLLFGLLFFCSAGLLMAQTNDQEFLFEILSPESIKASYDASQFSGTVDFGPMLTQEVRGELAWGYTAAQDSIGCTPVTNDLTGKIALIRRGDCNFSLKIYHAQEAGAAGVIIVNNNIDNTAELVGMLGGDSATAVVIPAIFISYAMGDPIAQALAGGETVEGIFRFPTFTEALGPWAFMMPQDNIIPMDQITVRVINRTGQDQPGVVVGIEVMEPSGNVVNLSSVKDVGIDGDSTFTFESYTPSELGRHQMKFISDLTNEEITRDFVISEHTWDLANDNGKSFPSNSADFAVTNIYQTGNLIFAGQNGATVTHVSFGLGNGSELYTGPGNNFVTAFVYKGDADGDNVIDLQNSFDDLEFASGDAFGEYEITGNEDPNDVLTIEFDAPVVLDPGEVYYVSMFYSVDAAEPNAGISPQFAASPKVNYPTSLAGVMTPLYLDQLYSGWSTATVVTQLHTDGYVGVRDLDPLDKNEISVVPNPVNNGVLKVQLNLNEFSENAEFAISNLEGKVMRTFAEQNVKDDVIEYRVSDLASGTYFVRVVTEHGFRTKSFVIAK